MFVTCQSLLSNAEITSECFEVECARNGSGSTDDSVENKIIKPSLFQKYNYPAEVRSLHYPKCWYLITCHAALF